jgi:hypothetical protein
VSPNGVSVSSATGIAFRSAMTKNCISRTTASKIHYTPEGNSIPAADEWRELASTREWLGFTQSPRDG